MAVVAGDGHPEPADSAVAGPRTNFEAVFELQYSESGPDDCGFQKEPNSHVDGWVHFQERPDPDTEYDYEPATLDARSPTAALWGLLDLLANRLKGDEENGL